MAESKGESWEDIIDKLCMWLRANAAHRVASKSFGRQAVEVIWQGGVPTLVNIDERTQIAPKK